MHLSIGDRRREGDGEIYRETYACSRWPGVEAPLTTDVTLGRRKREEESNTHFLISYQ